MNNGGGTVRTAVIVAMGLSLAGCNPYLAATSAVTGTFDAATDIRSLSTQESDTQAEVQIKAALLASPVSGTSGIDVYCRRGVVVLVGVVPPGSSAGQAAVRMSRETPGVKRVETYFVPSRPSWTNDFEIKEEIRTKLVADPSLLSGRVDVAVYAGHVILVGVVASPAIADKFVSDARGEWCGAGEVLHSELESRAREEVRHAACTDWIGSRWESGVPTGRAGAGASQEARRHPRPV